MFIENDGNAAAIAELFYGCGRQCEDFVYLFLGSAIGGGIAIEGDCLRGGTGNAGDIGIMPVPPSRLSSAPQPKGEWDILLSRASLNALARHLRHSGETISNRFDLTACIERKLPAVDEWIDDCIEALAPALHATLCVVDVPAIVLDADVDSGLLDTLLDRLRVAMAATAPEARSVPALIRVGLVWTPGPLARPRYRCSSTFRRARACSTAAAPNRRRLAMPTIESRPVLLQMRGISKTFPGVRALDNVSLTVYPGEVHSLMGENGAGKSTLMKILSGAYQADPGGEIIVDGKVVSIDGPMAAKQLGIAVIYQELSLAPNLSVAENIHAGRELRKGGRWSMVDRPGMERGSEDVLKRLGATFRPQTLVGDLSIAEDYWSRSPARYTHVPASW